jgi:hypothetical protein
MPRCVCLGDKRVYRGAFLWDWATIGGRRLERERLSGVWSCKGTLPNGQGYVLGLMIFRCLRPASGFGGAFGEMIHGWLLDLCLSTIKALIEDIRSVWRRTGINDGMITDAGFSMIAVAGFLMTTVLFTDLGRSYADVAFYLLLDLRRFRRQCGYTVLGLSSSGSTVTRSPCSPAVSGHRRLY